MSGAGARGNVALAKGTLMGELGPELYVQNGSYHIAGSNGPEFVDLADDAIVFNHLQTKKLLENGIDEPSEAEWIVSLILDIKRNELNTENLVTPKYIEQIEKIVQERITGRPLWYCIGILIP